MPFIGTPKTSAENRIWLGQQKYMIDVAIMAQDWGRGASILIETINRCLDIIELEEDLIGLYEKLAICYAGLGEIAGMNEARAKAAEIRSRRANN
ncbi:hypothetical protein PWT90_07624 [Aphanocladium album]|nr:hypothetical protein PWT90_07624 [Aphanocladium album]